MYGDDLLIGDKVRLTALTRDDLPTFARWLGSMELRRLLSPGRVIPFNMDDEKAWYDSITRPEDRPFAIRTLEDDRLLGSCGIHDINWQSRHGIVGIMIGERDAWGKGYGSDALNVLLRYCFNELNLNRVALQVFSYNTRARRAYEKLGFVHEGTLREAILRDGVYHDILLMAILAREYAARA